VAAQDQGVVHAARRAEHRTFFPWQWCRTRISDCLVFDSFLVHENLHDRPVRPYAELEHQSVGRPPIHANQTALVQQLEVMRVAEEREIPCVVGTSLGAEAQVMR
jgi:hypothetical protein